MPTINKSFLLKLFLVVALVTAGVFGVHAVQARRIPDALKRQADRAADSGKPDVAIHYLRQYLEFRPADVDSRERLASLVKERRGGANPTELLFLYDQILRTAPDRDHVRKEALALSLRIARYSDAEAHAEILLKNTPADPALWQQAAAAQAGQNNRDAARKSYEMALRHDPKNIVAYQRLAQFVWRDVQRPDEARKILDRMVAALPHEAEAFLTRAKFDAFTNFSGGRQGLELASNQGIPDGGQMADLRKALEVDPENADALLMMAEQLQKRRDPAGARDCLADAVRLYPQDARMVRALAWLELNRGNLGAAVAVLEDGLERIKDTGFDLLVPLADLLVQMGETSRTETIVKRLEARPEKAARMQTTYLKSRLAMRREDWPAAITLLSGLRTDAVGLPGLESQTNLLLAACHQRRGDRDAEQDALKLILNKDRHHLAARVGLGQSYLYAGRFADAEQEYNEAVRSPYATGPTHATLVRLKAARLRAAGTASPKDWELLDKIAAELQQPFGAASPEPALLRAELATLRGDSPKAIAILKAEAVRRPGEPRLWAALASAVADVAGVAAGLSVLDEAQASAGDGAEVRLARADLYARDPARLRPVAPLADQIDTWPDADQLRLLFGMLEIADRVGDDAGVMTACRRIAARRPNDIPVWESLAERAYRCKDAKAVADARAALTRLDPAGRSVALCDGWAALAANDLAAAATAAAGVTKTFGESPDRAEACVVLGRLKAATGDAAAAGKMFDRAGRLDPGRFGPIQETLAFAATAPGGDAG
ncbi:MAG: tetratricopeptide repeat protein, partial [Fimbriiglobus sp.]